MRKFYLFFVLLIVATGFIFAEGTKEAVKDTLVYATTEKITDMDPANAYDFHTWELFRNIGKGLIAYKPGTADLVPGLATSWEANSTGDAYTFKLREGVKFSDGTPFTAQTVKWSIDRVMKLEGDPSWLVTDFVKSVDVVDNYTVRFNLHQPVGYFPALAASVPYFPMNPNAYPEDRFVKDPSELKGGELSALGPYKIVSFKRDEEIVLEANTEYYGQAPKINRIVIRYYADATTMRLALERGEVDLVYKTLNPSDIADLSKNPNFNTYEVPSSYIRYLCFECSESVFKDARFRRAVAALIDRKPLIDRVFLGQMEPLYSMIPRGMIYHTDAFKTELGDGNVELANRLLAEAGYSESNPLEFELWYTPSHYGDTEVNMAEVLKAQFEKSKAVRVTLKSAEWATYIANMDTKQMVSFLLGWYPDYMDPDNYTAAFAGTAGSKGLGIYFSDPEWDALFRKEQGSTDPKEREQVFKDLQMMWTKEVPTAPIFQGKLFIFTQKNVTGVKVGTPMVLHYNTLDFTD